MNEDVQRKILRQLKLLNVWISVFGILFLVALGVIGFFLFQAVLFIKDTGDKVSNFQQSTTQSLDVKKQVCDGTDAFSTFVKSNTTACR